MSVLRLCQRVLLAATVCLVAGCSQPSDESGPTQTTKTPEGSAEKPQAGSLPGKPAVSVESLMSGAGPTLGPSAGDKTPDRSNPLPKPTTTLPTQVVSTTDPAVSPSSAKIAEEQTPALLPSDPPAGPVAGTPPEKSEIASEPALLAELARSAADKANPLRNVNPPAGGDRPTADLKTPVFPAATDGPRTTVPLSDVALPPERNTADGKRVEIRVRTDGDAKPTAKTPPSDTRPGPLRTGKHSATPYDPVKENGPVFVGWPKPQLALLISGRVDGYIEPCGCAGLDRMKGGMSRRATLFKTLRDQGWPVVGLDVGGIAKGFGRQAEMKFHIMVDGMRKMGYQAITLGGEELRLPTEEVLAATAPVDNQPSPFLSANVGLFDFDESVLAQSRVIEAGGRRIGVTGVLGAQLQKEVHNDTIKFLDPLEGLKRVMPGLKKKSDYLVLLAHASKAEAIALAQAAAQDPKLGPFDLVVAAGQSEEPPATAEKIPGTKTLLVEVGHKGMYAVVLGLYTDPQQPLRYQRVPLDSRYPAARPMQSLMAAYQDQLKTLGLDKLTPRPSPHPQRETNGRFVGSEKCQSCHETSYAIWKKTPHAVAYKSLVEANPPRNFDPECISCHVIGWHPTRFFPYESGYVSLEKTPKMINVGCEDCHGPGEKHVAAEMGSDKVLQVQMQKAVRITKAEASEATSHKQHCWTCHDLDNSPDFNFNTYWPQIEHYEKQ